MSERIRPPVGEPDTQLDTLLAKRKTSREQAVIPRWPVGRAKRQAFLEALGECRMNVSRACQVAGIANKRRIYEQRQLDPEFAAAWAEVESAILDRLEEDQFKSAEEGSAEDRRWILSRRRKERWSERLQQEIAAKIEVVNPKEMTTEQLEKLVRSGFHLDDSTPLDPAMLVEEG